jgi:hypothetical protein
MIFPLLNVRFLTNATFHQKQLDQFEICCEFDKYDFHISLHTFVIYYTIFSKYHPGYNLYFFQWSIFQPIMWNLERWR